MKVAKRNTFSVLFIIKKSKLLKNGDAPICMRITCNGEIVEIMIKRGVPVAQWNTAKECCRGNDRLASELNHYIETMRAKVYKIHRELEADGRVVSSGAIRDILNGNDNSRKTLIEVYSEHNEKCRALIGKDYAIATVEKFDTSLSHLKNFLTDKYNKKDILLQELTPEFITEFDFWLKTVHNCRQNSTLKHLIHLKKIVRIALANQWIKHDPFVTIKFKHEQTHIEFLT